MFYIIKSSRAEKAKLGASHICKKNQKSMICVSCKPSVVNWATNH